MMKHYPYLLFFVLAAMAVAACTNEGNKSANNTAPSGTARIKRCTDNNLRGFNDQGNWCRYSFEEALLVMPGADNPDQRLSDIPEGVSKFMINSSFFVVRKGAGPDLELFTSKLFPECLSKDADFRLKPDESGFDYDNGNGVKYSVQLLANGSFTRLLINFPAGSGVNIMAHRCETCR